MVCRIWTQNLENVVQCTTAWATIAGSCRTLSCIGSLSVHGLGDPMRLDRTVWKSLRASCQVSQFTIIEAGEVQRGQWMEFFEDLSGWRGSQQLQHLTPNGYWAPPPPGPIVVRQKKTGTIPGTRLKPLANHFRRPLSGSMGSYLENAIPMTTTLVNRMNRRSPTSPYVNRDHQRRSDPEGCLKKKVT